MHTKYQLILLGFTTNYMDIPDTFMLRANELGIKKDSIQIMDEYNFEAAYKPNSPSVCVYFGGDAPHRSIDILDLLINDAVFIIPTVSDLTNFSKLVPDTLRHINGFEFKEPLDTEPLVARIMEGLSLLRISRRLFISYRRVESRSVAIQLYEYLDECGFDVFLDTHNINVGEAFQDELWHRLVDTDLVVLLDTPDFLKSKWTEQELAKASAMSIGVLQLIWPMHTQEPYSALCFPVYLDDTNFEMNDFKSASANLTESTLKEIGSQVESLRARSLAARQDNLIQEFTATAKTLNLQSTLHPEKFITLIRKSDGADVAFIPTVGVPHAFTYDQSNELINRIRVNSTPEAFLIYDHRNIREKWQTHLTWLNGYLPVKALKITEIETWMQTF